MRRRFILSSLLVSLFGFACCSTAATNPPAIKFNSDFAGPFVVNSENVSLDINFYTTGTLKNKSVVCGFRLYRDDGFTVYKTFTSYPFGVELGVKPTIHAIIPFGGYLPKTGVLLEFYVQRNDEEIYTLPFWCYPCIEGTLNPTKGDVNEYTGTVFKLEVNKVVVSKEQYIFSENVGNIVEDSYYRLNIDQFNFLYEPIINPTYESAQLMIINPPFCFSGLKKANEKSVSIALEITYKDKWCIFSYKETMYVDPKTLLMSKFPQQGYLATHYLYLPLNYYETIIKTNFTINIKGFGPSKRNFSWNIKYLETNQFIGDCSFADYCVTGGIS